MASKSLVAVNSRSPVRWAIVPDSWILQGVCLVFGLLFVGQCYDSLDRICKLISVAISFACFFTVAVHDYGFRKTEVLYMTLIFTFLLFEYVYVGYKYQQPLTTSFSGTYYYCYAVLLPVFNYLLERISRERVLDALESAALVISIFMLIVASLMNFGGINITQVTRQRSDTIRIVALVLVQMCPIISLYLYINNISNKLKHIIALVVCLTALVYVSQSRLNILVIIVCLALTLILHYRKNAALTFIALCIVLMVGGSLILFGPLGQLLGSFSLNSEYGGNTLTRIWETDYYLELFRTNPFNGTGLITYGTPAYSIIAGPYGNYYIDDVGIIGALAMTGLWVVPIFIIPLIVLIVCVARQDCWKGLGWPIILYVACTMFTWLPTFPYFDPFWLFILAFFCSKI